MKYNRIAHWHTGKLFEKKIVHRGYSATERQIGTVYDGWRIVTRLKVSRFWRWLYDGKTWAFVGEHTRYWEGL